MQVRRYRVPKVGSGSMVDPYRPKHMDEFFARLPANKRNGTHGWRVVGETPTHFLIEVFGDTVEMDRIAGLDVERLV